jgi:hypothetical protein
MIRKNVWFVGILLVLTITLSACSEDDQMNHGDMNGSDSHEKMEHSDSGEVPEGLEKAENPTYEIGSKVTITEGHMKGMKGAEATVTGAYDTIAYMVSYTPTTGGERVENHKWVIQEEIKDAGDEPIGPGSKVTLNASHMKGMDGATAEIESAERTTVYMVDYISTTTGEKVENHKWVTESELTAEN